jgi:hypothetical protein
MGDKMKQFTHGEVVVFQIKKLPNGVKKIKAVGGKYIIADSETTGNHHCIEEKDGVEMFEKDGILYLTNEVNVDMFCVNKNRHDTEVLEPSIYEIDKAREYDFLTEETRRVAD